MPIQTQFPVTFLKAIPPTITTATLPNTAAGVAYSETIATTGGTPTFTISAGTLPEGFTLDENSGELNGVAEAAGEFNFTVTATNSGGSDAQAYTINVSIGSAPVLLTPEDDAILTSYSPAFTWVPTAGATAYDIEVATDSGFTAIVITETVDTPSFTPSADLTYNRDFYWRVKGTAGASETAFSTTSYFSLWILYAGFPTEYSAGNVPTPYTEELVDLTLTETDGSFAVTSGELRGSGKASSGYGELYLLSAQLPLIATRRALMFQHTAVDAGNHETAVVLRNASSIGNINSDSAMGFRFTTSGAVTMKADGSSTNQPTIGTYSSATTASFGLVFLSATRIAYFINARLVFIATLGTTYNFLIVDQSSILTDDYDELRMRDLLDTFPVEVDLLVLDIASPVDAQEYTGVINQILEITLTAPGTITEEAGVIFRKQDATNYWRMYFNTAGAFRLDRVVAGVANNHVNVAAVIAATQTRTIRVTINDSALRCHTLSGSNWSNRGGLISNTTFENSVTVQPDIGADWTASNLRSYSTEDAEFSALAVTATASYSGGDGWFASVTADAGSEGTAADPMLLQEILQGAGGRLQNGQTITLLDGVHLITENTTCAASTLTIQAQNFGAATIDATGDTSGQFDVSGETLQLIFSGSNVQIEGIVVRSSPVTRTTPERFQYPPGQVFIVRSGNNPTPVSTRSAWNGCILSNYVTCGNFTVSVGGVFAKGTIFYDVGFRTVADGDDGEFWYTQNLQTSPDKIVRGCLMGRSFGLAVQQYSETSNNIWNYLVEDVTLLSEFYALAGVSRKNVTLNRLLAWKSRISNGRTGQTQQDIAITNSYNVGADIIVGDSSGGATVSGNTLVRLDGVGSMDIGENLDATLTVDNNHYYGNVILKYDGSSYTFANWQSVLGFDLNGTYSATLPTTNETFVVVIDDVAGVLGQVTVYNWESTNQITIDLNALGVTNGQEVILRSIDNPLNDARTLTVSGTSVTVDLTTRTVSTPIGHDEPLDPDLDIRFSAWRVETV